VFYTLRTERENILTRAQCWPYPRA